MHKFYHKQNTWSYIQYTIYSREIDKHHKRLLADNSPLHYSASAIGTTPRTETHPSTSQKHLV